MNSLDDQSRRYWTQATDTHAADARYYERAKGVLPLLCELHLDPSHRALDVGCGNGEYTAVIARHCATIDAFDIAPALIQVAQTRAIPNAQFSTADTDHLLELPDASYDAIALMGVSAVLIGDQLEATVGQVARVLRPGGTLITRDSVAADTDIVRVAPGGYPAHYRSQSNFVHLFSRFGFRLLRTVYLDTFGDLTNHFFVFTLHRDTPGR